MRTDCTLKGVPGCCKRIAVFTHMEGGAPEALDAAPPATAPPATAPATAPPATATATAPPARAMAPLDNKSYSRLPMSQIVAMETPDELKAASPTSRLVVGHGLMQTAQIGQMLRATDDSVRSEKEHRHYSPSELAGQEWIRDALALLQTARRAIPGKEAGAKRETDALPTMAPLAAYSTVHAAVAHKPGLPLMPRSASESPDIYAQRQSTQARPGCLLS